MPSFGEKLKLQREKSKISLEEISATTKIGTRMLQALEENKFSQLPGGIFNKGFVRAYARCVGLDEDQTVADYLQASGDAPPVSAETVPQDQPPPPDRAIERQAVEPKPKNKKRSERRLEIARTPSPDQDRIRQIEASADAAARQFPWGLFASILLAVALVLFFWRHHEREQQPEKVDIQPKAAEIRPVAQASNQAASNATAQTPSPESATIISRETHPAEAGAGDFTVAVQAREQSWVSIMADGKNMGSELLAAGAQRVARGRTTIVIKAGNAGAVDFIFNGKKLAAAGDFGQVETITFGPHGVQETATSPSTTP